MQVSWSQIGYIWSQQFDEEEQSFLASATGSVKSQQVVPDLEIPVGFTVSQDLDLLILNHMFYTGLTCHNEAGAS